jgi:two-component system chemotaxis response regulator CheY
MHQVILHVEDNRDVVEVVAMTFHSLGFDGQILHAADAASALSIIWERRARNLPLDLLLLDISLPNGSGLEVIRSVKSNPAWAAIPVVVLSNESDEKIVSAAYALGANCYFPKLSTGQSGIDVLETLHTTWIKTALLPPRSPTNLPEEIVGRAVSAIAQTSRFFTELARRFSNDFETSRLWLDMALNASNNANLLSFFHHAIRANGVPAESLERLNGGVKAREVSLREAEESLAATKTPALDQALGWVFSVFKSFDPDKIRIAFQILLPSSPAAVAALRDTTIRQALRLTEFALTKSTNPEIHAEARSLEIRILSLQFTPGRWASLP